MKTARAVSCFHLHQNNFLCAKFSFIILTVEVLFTNVFNSLGLIL